MSDHTLTPVPAYIEGWTSPRVDNTSEAMSSQRQMTPKRKRSQPPNWQGPRFQPCPFCERGWIKVIRWNERTGYDERITRCVCWLEHQQKIQSEAGKL